jgi:uncharacterized protein YacL
MFHVLRGAALICGPLVGYFIGHTTDAALIGLGVAALVIACELVLERIPLEVLLFGAIGGGAGLLLAKVIDWSIYRLDNPAYYRFVSTNSFVINLFLVYLGCMVAVKKRNEVDVLDRSLVMKGSQSKDLKIIDTSSLIDGRIADVFETGFLSGKLIIPRRTSMRIVRYNRHLSPDPGCRALPRPPQGRRSTA